jgi:outer membrane protein assembly factor BamD
MDDVLVGLGDAYEEEAKYYRGSRLPEDAKARLVKLYDGEAADCYRKVVLEHSAAAHVEDARDRLTAMNLPIPTPTPEQAAASEALENSRGQYTLSKRAVLFLLHRPDTVQAATIGQPPLQDAQRTLAPTVLRRSLTDFTTAVTPGASGPAPAPKPAAPAEAASSEPAPAAPAAPAAPLAFQDVPAAGAGNSSGAVVQPAAVAAPATTGGGTGVGGIEIVQPSANSPAAPAQAPGTPPPAFPGSQQGTAPAQPAAAAPPATANYGLPAMKPSTPQPLPPVEKATDAPAAVNEVPAGSQPAAQNATPGKKAAPPAFDKSDESSSKHKKKKGLAKLNPF